MSASFSWRQDKGTKFNFNKRKLFAKDFYTVFFLLLPLVFLPKRSIFVGIFCLLHKGESIASQL